MAKITDDQIKWTLSLDAGGVQGEINTLSSTIRSLEKENISLSKSMKDIDREMKDMEKDMAKLTKAGKDDGRQTKETITKLSKFWSKPTQTIPVAIETIDKE